jgi:NAD(P)-dependent dehydrogenase (short-subunit alcohol dehydrogenase family)
MAGRLANKACIITGAASGQGRVAAQFFAREGAQLLLADVDKDGIEEIDRLLRNEEHEAALFVGDLTEEAVNEQMVAAAVQQLGRVDALYNAAGLVRFSPAHETSIEDWRFVLDHELTITFLACKHALRAMIEAGSGSIINISSVSGLYGSPNHAAHAATKAGIAGLTRQIAVDYGTRGVRCNAIAPGFLVYGPGQRRIESQTARFEPTGIPLGRFCTPEDTAWCAIYLASDESSFMTGQVLIVDGGISAR